MNNITASFIFILISGVVLFWVLSGIVSFFYLDKEATKKHSYLKGLYLLEKEQADLSKSVKSYLPRLKAETDYALLLSLISEKEKSPVKYYILNIAKSIVIGPLYFIF